MRIATDVGGTFTDLVGFEQDEDGRARITTRKVDSTPPHFEKGVLELVAPLDPAGVDFFAHGSTVVINALVSREGAKTALLTTKGFRDVLEIARGSRPDLFNFKFSKPEPFVPRHLRFEVTERVDADGRIVEPVELTALEDWLASMRAHDVEAVAICFLHAYANPENERRVSAALREAWPEVSVVASHEVCGEWREYERSSTTVLSAYVHPVVDRYLAELDQGLNAWGYTQTAYMLQSNGGLIPATMAASQPIALVESGPACGVLGAVELAKALGETSFVTLDVGGTTAKCSLIEGLAARITNDYCIERTPRSPGYPIKTPVVEIVEIGSGGGSIARLDAGNKLHVGPQSAGADPGPAVYGRGGRLPTTTDAHIVSGHLDPFNLLGGKIEPDLDAVEEAFAPLCRSLKMSRQAVARGVLAIADADMANALKLISVNQGYDPREFALVAFGGGGALHAASLGKALRFRKVIIPPNPSVFSAWGMLVSDLRRDFVATHGALLDSSSANAEPLSRSLDALATKAIDSLSGQGRVQLEGFADLRYQGQEHTVKVPFPGEAVTCFDRVAIEALIEQFHFAHERAFSFRLDRPVELVNLHLGAVVKMDRAQLPLVAQVAQVAQTRGGATINGHRRVDFGDGEMQETAIYDRSGLGLGSVVKGPAVIEEPASTCLVPPDSRAEMDRFGSLHLSV